VALEWLTYGVFLCCGSRLLDDVAVHDVDAARKRKTSLVMRCMGVPRDRHISMAQYLMCGAGTRVGTCRATRARRHR
jgi:hypothetical protein